MPKCLYCNKFKKFKHIIYFDYTLYPFLNPLGPEVTRVISAHITLANTCHVPLHRCQGTRKYPLWVTLSQHQLCITEGHITVSFSISEAKYLNKTQYLNRGKIYSGLWFQRPSPSSWALLFLLLWWGPDGRAWQRKAPPLEEASKWRQS